MPMRPCRSSRPTAVSRCSPRGTSRLAVRVVCLHPLPPQATDGSLIHSTGRRKSLPMSVEPAESSGGYGSYRKLRDTHEAPPNRSSWFAGTKTESAIGHVDGSRAHRTSRENDADAAPELEPNGITSALPWVSQKITPLTATERRLSPGAGRLSTVTDWLFRACGYRQLSAPRSGAT
jgi:hypothetical protein